VRIAVLSPPWFPVPPTGYGGIEAIVSLLADGLVEAGHDVTLFAPGDSSTSATLASVYPEAPSDRIGQILPELHHVFGCYERAAEFDVVSDHSGPAAAALGEIVDVPVVHTVHWPLDGEAGDVYAQVARLAPSVHFVSLSLNQRAARPQLPWLANCPNALDLRRYPFTRQNGARRNADGAGEYLVFLGRMAPEKGCHHAVEVAERANVPLKIAAKMREAFEEEYFAEYVEPRLRDSIQYLGEVSHDVKVDLLRNARATLFPIDWEEPFGLVMIESIACGTPVIATRRGAVPEVLEDGVNGFVVDDVAEMVEAVSAVDALDRASCRKTAAERFSAERLVRDYEMAFERAVAR